jgi:dihydrofolate reductase
MKASILVGTSLDGFIARADGALDFLPPDGGEPHGYVEFMATVDALVIGRKTYETEQRLVVTRVPVLKHIATRQYAGGLVQSEYEISI